MTAPPAGVVDALSQQLLAGARLPGDEHRGVGGGVLLRQGPGAAHGGGIAQQLGQAVLGDELARPVLGTQVAVGALDRGRVLEGEHGAGRRPLLADGNAVGDHGAGADALDHPHFRRALLEGMRQGQVGGDLAPGPPQRLVGGHPHQLLHGRVDGLHPLLHVHRHHALVQMAQDDVEALAPRLLDARQARQLDGVVQGLAHGVPGIEEHAGQVALVGQIADQAGAHHHLHAARRQVLHLLAGVGQGRVAAQLDVQIEQPGELLQLGTDLLVSDDGHARGYLRRLHQGAHDVEAAHLDDHHREIQVAAQEGAVGAGGHEYVHLAGIDQLPGRVQGLLEAPAGDADVGPLLVVRHHAFHQP